MNLIELRDRVLTLPALEKRKTLLVREIWETERHLSELLQKYKSESRDVERLSDKSFAGFLLKLVGKYEDRLDREQQEEISAKLNYDRMSVRLDSLTQEQEELSLRISALREDERVYRAELQKRREELKTRLAEPDGIKLSGLEAERGGIVSLITEIKEAQSAASRAKATAIRAADALDSARRWATYDVIADGGILSHMAKYSHVDSAEREVSVLSSQLRSLKSELADVRGVAFAGISEISATQRAVDFWFDNIFTDLAVRDKITNNADDVRRVLGSIRSVEATLTRKLSEESKKLEENRLQLDDLLISFGLEG